MCKTVKKERRKKKEKRTLIKHCNIPVHRDIDAAEGAPNILNSEWRERLTEDSRKSVPNSSVSGSFPYRDWSVYECRKGKIRQKAVVLKYNVSISRTGQSVPKFDKGYSKIQATRISPEQTRLGLIIQSVTIFSSPCVFTTPTHVWLLPLLMLWQCYTNPCNDGAASSWLQTWWCTSLPFGARR